MRNQDYRPPALQPRGAKPGGTKLRSKKKGKRREVSNPYCMPFAEKLQRKPGAGQFVFEREPRYDKVGRPYWVSAPSPDAAPEPRVPSLVQLAEDALPPFLQAPQGWSRPGSAHSRPGSARAKACSYRDTNALVIGIKSCATDPCSVSSCTERVQYEMYRK